MKSKLINLSLQVIPVQVTNGYPIVDQAIAVIQQSGLKYEVTAFDTVIEGEWAALIALVEKVKETVFSAGAPEVLFNMQFHMKNEQDVRMAEKTDKFRA
jgi:uncharacterized protein (TIGR00106 family)